MARLSLALAPFALVVAAGLVVSCTADPKSPTDDGGNPPDPNATFTRVQNEVFTPSCAFSGCHADPAPQQGMNLSAGNSYAAIVGVASKESNKLRISPFEPDDSYLVNKIRGDVGISGDHMPLGGPSLGEARIQLVVDWVRRGAPND